MSYRTVLFDLDGTLLDSVELILTSYRHTLAVHRGAPPDDAVWLQGLGTPLREQFRVFTHDQAEIEAMVRTYREYNLAHHDAMARPYPGITEAVGALRAREVALGVVTSKLHGGARRGLQLLGIEAWFTVVIGADDVERAKPHPDPVLKAVEALAADVTTTVFIGDSPHDMAAGRAAGVRTAAVLWGPFTRAHLTPHAPDHWLSAPDDLLRLAPPAE